MTQPTLTAVFGAGATQDATTVTIQKAALIGLTASANNSAESIFASMVLTAAAELTATNRTSNADQNIAIETGYDTIAYNGQTPKYQSALNITLQKDNPVAAIDPDDY